MLQCGTSVASIENTQKNIFQHVDIYRNISTSASHYKCDAVIIWENLLIKCTTLRRHNFHISKRVAKVVLKLSHWLLKTAFFVKTSDSNNFSISIGYANFHHQKAFNDENSLVCQAPVFNINVEATGKSCGTVQPDVVDNALTNTVNHGTRAGLKNSAQL